MALTDAEELELLLLAEAEQSEPVEAPQPPNTFQKMLGMKEAPKQASPLDALHTFNAEMQSTGEDIAGTIAQKAVGTPFEKIAPYVGAAVGTPVTMASDIIGGAALRAPTAVKGAATLAQKGVQAAGEAAGTISKIASAGERLAGLEERLLMQQEALGSVGERIAARGSKLAEEKTALGQAIGKAEELGGYAMKQMPEEFHKIVSDPEAIQAMGKQFRKIADTPIQKLTEDKNALQTIRKFAQFVRENGRAVSTDLKANISMGGHQASQKLRQVDEVFDSVISKWENVDNKLRTLKQSAGTQKAAIQSAIRQTRQAIRETKRLVTLRKGAVQAGATVAGLGYIGSLFSKLVGGE